MTDKQEKPPIDGPEWHDADGAWYYTVKSPDGAEYILSILPADKKRNILTLWQGGPDGPADDKEIMSDPIDIRHSNNLDRFLEQIEYVFDDRDVHWFSGVLEWLRMKHVKEVEKWQQKELKKQLREKAERRIKGTPYVVTDEGLAMEAAHELVPLANFDARITEDLLVDVGGNEEPELFFKIEAHIGGETITLEIPDTAFDSMGWVRRLGSAAVIEPIVPKGHQHVRTAIQKDSNARRIRSVAHTGWREIGGRYGFIHAGGTIFGWQGWQSFEVRIVPRGKMKHRVLPAPSQNAELREAVRATLKLWDAADDAISIPVDSAAKRAALGRVNFSVHLGGPTGMGKTALALVAASYFGTGPRAEEHHASYFWTPGAIEEEAFRLKDTLLILDEFLPHEPRHKEVVDRVLRSAANNSGRGRLTEKGEKWPRALLLSTGEDFPSGESLVARVLVIRILEGGGVDVRPGSRIRECATDAAGGLYPLAMAGFIAWVAERGYEKVQQELEEARVGLEESAWDPRFHPRMPGIFGELLAAQRLWLDYSLSIGAIADAEYQRRLERAEVALRSALVQAEAYQSVQNPVEHFAELLHDVFVAGKAHLGDPTGFDGWVPARESTRWGWRESADGHEPQGACLGWVIGDEIFLYPRPALTLAKEQARATGAPLEISQQMLNRRLAEQGLLLSTNPNKSRGVPVRKTVRGKTGTFLHLRVEFIGT